MITPREIEMLASLLARAGVTVVEAAWANGVLQRLRALVTPTLDGAQSDPESDLRPERLLEQVLSDG